MMNEPHDAGEENGRNELGVENVHLPLAKARQPWHTAKKMCRASPLASEEPVPNGSSFITLGY